MTARWETALLGLCLALSGLVALAIGYGGTGTYVSIMRDRAPAIFHLETASGARAEAPVDLPTLTGWHNAWFLYVTGDASSEPASWGGRVFTPSEYAHMADVRGVFVASRIAAGAAGILGLGLVLGVARRGRRAAVVLIRDGALAAAVGVAVIAVAAVVAFDPLFLLFHEVFFPQGNFLFAADSNLLAVYPDEYWYGVTLRIGFTFAAAMAVIALAATATLRQARR
jgi:hypothetical protein